MKVTDVLRSKGRGAISVAPEATVGEAIELLVEHNIGSLPVVDLGRVVGIFTERDVLRGVHNCGEGFCRTRIDDVMTRGPVVCDADEPVHDAMGRMSAHKVGQLPVLEGEELVGVVSVGDLVRILHEHAEAENRHLLTYLYGSA